MYPTDRDLAEFAQLGLRYGLLCLAQVQRWADTVIAERAEPPPWAIELATAELNDTIHLLNSVPGKASVGLPLNLLVGLVHRKWRKGDLSIQRVKEIGWQLHLEDQLPQPETGGDWGTVLYCEYEDFEQGYRTAAQMQAAVEEKVTPWAAYEGHLPVWARYPQTC